MGNTSKSTKSRSRQQSGTGGRLRIGNSWNAITIIALSQNNPLKAIAEFVENSIDARARDITIVRGRERGELFLKVIDDGQGIPLTAEGIPDFKYVATHICDSAKKKLKKEGVEGIQGEFGIGLLSFWTVGERLILAAAGANGRTYQMEMRKNAPGYRVVQKRSLFSHPGTELIVFPLLPGLRQLSGEKMQNYLASELRDRIRRSGVRIRIKDRLSRKEFDVRPREYSGRLLHELDAVSTEVGEVYLEIYLDSGSADNTVSLFRSGTRVMPSITKLDFFDGEPWTSGYLQGMIDVPFLQLTPGTRDGVVQDDSYFLFCEAMKEVDVKLKGIIEQVKRAEEEEASRKVIRSIQKAIKEALLTLPPEDYDWFDITSDLKRKGHSGRPGVPEPGESALQGARELAVPAERDALELSAAPKFFEYAGPLFKVLISPSSSVVQVGTSRNFRCLPRDRKKRLVEHGVEITWEIEEGEGELSAVEAEVVSFSAPEEPGMTVLKVTAVQGETVCTAQSLVTVAENLIEKSAHDGKELNKGLPGYTYRKAPGELWRSHFDEKNNLIVINNGHRDFVFASRKQPRKLRYICRLYAKELVLANFVGFTGEQLLERMIELILYTEEHLK